MKRWSIQAAVWFPVYVITIAWAFFLALCLVRLLRIIDVVL